MARLLFLALFLQLSSAHAVLMATFDSTQIDYSKETDIFVVGYAGAVGSGFLRTALTYAHKSHEQYPNRQIVFYVENRDKDGTSSKFVSALGLTLVSYNIDPLTTTKLVGELKSFEQIHTLHVVSHAALEDGIGLTDRDDDGRWNHRSPGFSDLKFTKDGFALLHGCNTGFLQAPEWSRQMGVPVFGSLTATNFQQIFDDGEWYFHDVGLYPKDASFLKKNYVAFSDPVPCSQGGCYRLKSDYFTYNGYWGDFAGGGGLSFYKAFCNFQTTTAVRTQICQTAMRQLIQIFPSHLSLPAQPTLEEYKDVVKDLLCGIHPKKNIRQECYDKLAEAEANPKLRYGGFEGNPLQCDNFGSCDVTYKCKSTSSVHVCALKAPKNTAPTTLVEEYLHYLAAF